MFRVAYVLYAEEHCCTCCDGSLLDLSKQENAMKYKDVRVLMSLVCFSNMDYTCFV